MTQLGDSYWLSARDFVKARLQLGERIIAPAKFQAELPNTFSYKSTHKRSVDQFQWIVIHKGMLEAINPDFLKQTIAALPPVFANEVFVIFAARPDLVPSHFDANHLQPLLEKTGIASPAPVSASKSSPIVASVPSLIKQRLQQRQPASAEHSALNASLEGIAAQLNSQLNMVLSHLHQLEQTVANLKSNQPDLVQPAPVRIHRSPAELSVVTLQQFSRAECQTAYLGNQEILCRVLGTYLLYGDTTDIGIVPHLCLNGCWEPWLTLAILRTLRPGWFCLDVGANHGYYALVAAGAVKSTGRVLALEPNFKLTELIRKSLEVNGFNQRASVQAIAASDTNGETVKLVIPKGNTGHASLHRSASESDEVMTVETVTIDRLTADWPQVDFIKIDTEGAEAAIWRGMRETIRKNSDIVIILEFGADRYPNPRAFLEEIQAEGFILRYVDYDAQVKELTIEQCLTERPGSYWDLFLQRD